MNSVKMLSVTEEEGGVRLDRWFKWHYPELSHAGLEKLLRTGQVRVDGARSKSNKRLSVGQVIRVPPRVGSSVNSQSKSTPKVNERDAELLRDAVLHMDQHVLVINKPAGLAVQGGSNTVKHLDGMLDVLNFGATERPRLVHRLDKDTSGVLILARSRKSATILGESFRSKEARKVYWAIVVGVPRQTAGNITLSLKKKSGVGGDKVVVDDNGREAITIYRIIEKAGGKALSVPISRINFYCFATKLLWVAILSFLGTVPCSEIGVVRPRTTARI